MSKIHLSLNVRDLSRSVAFYEAFLGVAPHKVRPGYTNFDVEEPPLKLALNEDPEGAPRGVLNHLGVLMPTPAEVHAVKDRLQASGLATFDETDTTCCFAKQDKVWVHDPDGNPWEVYAITDDLLDDHEHDHAGRPLGEATGDTPAQFTPTVCCTPAATGPVCCGGRA